MPTPSRRRVGLVALAIALITGSGGAATAAASPRAPQAPRAVAPAAATFTDDFDGAAGAGVDQSKWRFETGDNVNNHEREYYTSGTHNAALDGQGHLVITARKENPNNYQCWYGTCQYTSARLNTASTFTQAYGHFETRMKIPRGQGMWPAFWMLGNDIGSVGWPTSGEIDIMENVGFEPGTVHGTIHGPGYSGSAGIGAGYTLAGRPGVRRRLPHLRDRLGAELDHVLGGRERVRDPAPADLNGEPLGVRPSRSTCC